MPIMIGKAVGESGTNNGPDVLKVDELLRAVGMLGSISPTTQTRNEAIKCFQEIWELRSAGKYNGTIEPNGATLQRLNQTATPLKLNEIGLKKIGKGGYKISFTGDVPPKPYQVWLGRSAVHADYVDITGCNAADVMTPNNLPELLKIIQRHNSWGLNLELKLFVVLKGKVITTSLPKLLACPVRPHNAKLLPLDDENNGDQLTYQGDAVAKTYNGRWLQKAEGFDGLFFAYFFDPATGDSNFETDSTKRGFDCITYAGTACGVPPMHIGATSSLLAYLQPTKCLCDKQVPATKPGQPPTTTKVELESADAKDIANFFKVNNSGYYLMWSSEHVVLVADGFVHEFSASKKGYRWASTDDWLDKRGKLSVRKLTTKPARAV